ncbi:hypothetical protein BHE74_00032169, partial [Ensete ventricosum]
IFGLDHKRSNFDSNVLDFGDATRALKSSSKTCGSNPFLYAEGHKAKTTTKATAVASPNPFALHRRLHGRGACCSHPPLLLPLLSSPPQALPLQQTPGKPSPARLVPSRPSTRPGPEHGAFFSSSASSRAARWPVAFDTAVSMFQIVAISVGVVSVAVGIGIPVFYETQIDNAVSSAKRDNSQPCFPCNGSGARKPSYPELRN